MKPEITKEQAEILRDYYELIWESIERSETDSLGRSSLEGVVWGIHSTLNHLGVKIEGVNA
ncbi:MULTISPECIES: hypothetical protein [unclassified Bacillus (in: firmicutes)]|uniref:hypothetical protein n=1 Tax=unclassified Bacillus (in: firmicutes) TaxID=185979 RepID=UPI00163CB39F|nr:MULTISPECIES: hypothetical protein [unclassified Bacillus (in: firmicutes)]QNH48691.1 hypothetical protein H7F25_04250 [Bacillus sp. PAMC28571]QNK42986.1 hypothetical protein H7F24_10815 [Bacillus sp. PAMC22265]